MKLDLIPFGPIMPPPDLILALRHPQYIFVTGGIREAGATVVAAAQSTTSLVPPLGNDKAKVLTLNLRNRLIFCSADEADAVQAADFIGKKRVVKRSWGFSAGSGPPSPPSHGWN